MKTALIIFALCVISAVFAVTLKSRMPEYALLLSLGITAVVLVYIISQIVPAVKRITDRISRENGELSFVKTALKITVIGYLSEISSDVCKDYGQTAIGKIAQTGGKCIIFILCVPLVLNLLDTALEFLKL